MRCRAVSTRPNDTTNCSRLRQSADNSSVTLAATLAVLQMQLACASGTWRSTDPPKITITICTASRERVR